MDAQWMLIFASNGCSSNLEEPEEAKTLCSPFPSVYFIFSVFLGFQILALVLGSSCLL